MKKIILILNFIFSFQTWAVTAGTRALGKVVSFDMKTVTIEIAGKNHIFDREKLGKDFVGLKKGETVEIDTDKVTAAQKK